MNPTSRKQFADYCLRALGAPVLEINVSDEQIDDRIDFALKTYYDYHFDGSEKCYYRYTVGAKNNPNVLSEVVIVNPGTGYDNADVVTITADPGNPSSGTGAAVSIVTDANGAIVNTNISAIGGFYYNPPTLSVHSTGGTGAKLVAFNGGYIPLPDNIIGAVNIFDIGDALQTENMFNIRYQIALNDLYTLTSVSMVPYYLAMQHIQFLEMMLVGKQPVRYNRHKNKLYIDMNWERFETDKLLIVEAYEIVDPDIYTKAWNDRWLLRYGTALIKQQWGNNLKKYSGMKMPGGLTFNGQIIYDEASAEIAALEHEMVNSYSLPVTDMIG